jgi:hypothetical protein
MTTPGTMRPLLVGAMLGGAIALTTLTGLRGQDDPSATPPDGPALQEMMQQFERWTNPGPEHRWMNWMIGDWTTTTTIMGMEPTAGTAKMEAVFGDRFIQQTWSGEMMGEPTTGVTFIGYDRMKKKFVSSWLDNISLDILTAEGMLDRTRKVLTLWGAMDEWMTGEHDKPVKYVITRTSEDTFTCALHDLAIIPGETKVIEITYERVKP